MKFRPIILNLFNITIFSIFLVSCQNNTFRESCNKMHSIIVKSIKLVETVEVKNVYDGGGNITATQVEQYNSQAKKYFQNSESEFLKHYELVKSYTQKPNEFYYDAIFILAFYNELLKFSVGNSIEDPCIYVKMIPTDKEVNLSKWFTDDLYGSIFCGGYSDLEQKWQNLDSHEKYQYILHFLDSPTKEGLKCIGLPDNEKYRQFPANNRT